MPLFSLYSKKNLKNNQTLQKINTFFTIMAITRAKLINGQYSCIASSHYLLESTPFSFYSKNMFERLNTVYNNQLNILMVGDKVDKIEIRKIGDSIYSNYTIYAIPPKEFLELIFLEKFFLDKDINKTIFMFYNLKYKV
jgi:hypothetical protein